MVQKLEAIRGGGGSIRVGATGTISALMTRELESIKPASQATVPSRDKARTIPVSVPCSATTPKRGLLQTRKSLDEGSSSGVNRRSPDTPQKAKHNRKSIHRIPILSSENGSLDRTPSRDKSDKRINNIVEVVDVKCGHQDGAWAIPIKSKLKKLGFSKLSESII